jgi:hypothetical protein
VFLRSTPARIALTYPGDRLYDPTGTHLRTPCITTAGDLGMLTSVCDIMPSTCGYEYCMVSDYPCHVGGVYYMNRVFDPSSVCLGTACTTTKGLFGRMVSKCELLPETCGDTYCVVPR